MSAPGLVRNDYLDDYYVWVLYRYSFYKYTVISPDDSKVLGYFESTLHLFHRMSSSGMGSVGFQGMHYAYAPGIGTSPGYYKAFVMYNDIYPMPWHWQSRPLANH